MPTGTLVSEEEYLHTVYEPACEFEDGVLIEKSLRTRSHSEVQALLTAYFIKRRQAWKIKAYTELNFRIRAGKYMIPDVAVVQDPQPQEQVLTAPPLIWIEILSPDDRHVRVNRKVVQVLQFGAPYVWVIDPTTLESELHTASGFTTLTDGTLRVPGTEIVVPLADIFED